MENVQGFSRGIHYQTLFGNSYVDKTYDSRLAVKVCNNVFLNDIES